jgi:hypothetical protein
VAILTKKRTAIVVIGLACVAFLSVYTRDPAVDPSIRYLAWKHGLIGMDLDRATGEMNLDVHRDSIVIGKTRQQLNEKFGYTNPLEQATPYVKNCLLNSSHADGDVVQLRRSDWVVLMQDGRAVQLISVEGC